MNEWILAQSIQSWNENSIEWKLVIWFDQINVRNVRQDLRKYNAVVVNKVIIGAVNTANAHH